MIGDDTDPFFDLDGFAVEVTLSKADGSGVVLTKGIDEEAALEEELARRASHSSFQPQITVPAKDALGFGEDDLVRFIPTGETIEKEFVILDNYSDGYQTTLTLEEK